ncbi:MAG: hypothetical protein LUG93_09495 [Lachnospiraceae bacterium]|nr:hypothetical protein [Lachnospiraceae bacterium]
MIKKIALKEDVFIIPIDKEDLERIYEGEYHIYALIHDKYIALKNDIDFGKYISKHLAEGRL